MSTLSKKALALYNNSMAMSAITFKRNAEPLLADLAEQVEKCEKALQWYEEKLRLMHSEFDAIHDLELDGGQFARQTLKDIES